MKLKKERNGIECITVILSTESIGKKTSKSITIDSADLEALQRFIIESVGAEKTVKAKVFEMPTVTRVQLQRRAGATKLGSRRFRIWNLDKEQVLKLILRKLEE